MTREEAAQMIRDDIKKHHDILSGNYRKALSMGIKALEQSELCEEAQHILDYLDNVLHPLVSPEHWNVYSGLHDMIAALLSAQPTISCDHENDTSSAQPDADKYEYHYDHTDCIWYRPEARNRCPSTCAQYRDGWNDAMQYIFRDGKGYRPYRRDKKYEHTD